MKCVFGPASPHTQMKPYYYLDLVVIKYVLDLSRIYGILKIQGSLIEFIHEVVQVSKDAVNILPSMPDDSNGEYRTEETVNALAFLQNQEKSQKYKIVNIKYESGGDSCMNVPIIEMSDQNESKVFSLKISSLWWGITKQIARGSGKTIVDTLIELIKRGILIDLLFYDEKINDALKIETARLRCIIVRYDNGNIKFEPINSPEEMLAYLETHTRDKAKTIRIPREFVNYIQLISKKFALSPSNIALIYIMSAVTHLAARKSPRQLGLDENLIEEIEQMNFLNFVVNHDGNISYKMVRGKKMEISQHNVKTSLKEIMKNV